MIAIAAPDLKRPTSFSAELDELSSVFKKGELADVAGVGAAQLTPGRLAGLSDEAKDRLDTLWVAVSLTRSLGIHDPHFFLRIARQPDLDYVTVWQLLREGRGQSVIEWLKGLTSQARPDTRAAATATTTPAGGLRPLGFLQRPPHETAALKTSGYDAMQLADTLSDDERQQRRARFVERTIAGTTLPNDLFDEDDEPLA